MTRRTVEDYPLAETRPEEVTGQGGKTLDEITLDAVLEGRVTMADLQITAEALRDQADIAADAGRPTLARNFLRGAEMVRLPPDLIMNIYELLRPGRARSADDIRASAALLRDRYDAPAIAAFLEEAAEVYDRRGLFVRRF